MNRKAFLRTVSLMTTSSINDISSVFGAEQADLTLIPIIDTHQHLVDINRFGKDWSRPPVLGNYDIHAYQRAIQGLNFVKAVYMEVAVPKERRHEEAVYAIELCKDKTNPTVAAVIKADVNDINFERYITQFEGAPFIKGIRGSFGARETIINERVKRNVQVLGNLNMSLDFSVPPASLSTMLELVQSCPGTKFLINHCGNVDPKAFLPEESGYGKADHEGDKWLLDMRALALEKNTVCKISGVVTRSTGYPLTAGNLAPAVNHCLEIFGIDRVMFASDWPWCLSKMDISGWVSLLKEIVADRPIEDQRKLFHDNAIAFYNI